MKKPGTVTVTTPSDREISVARVFNAPKRLVYAAHTKPELLKRWVGGMGWTLDVCEIDLVVGGAWRWVMRGPAGAAMGMGGVHREIVHETRIVRTEVFDQAWYEGEVLGTLSLAETEGKTTLTVTLLYDSKEIRDGVLKGPAISGMSANYDLLDAALETAEFQRA